MNAIKWIICCSMALAIVLNLILLFDCITENKKMPEAPTADNVALGMTPSPTETPLAREIFYFWIVSESEIRKLSAAEHSAMDSEEQKELITVTAEYFTDNRYSIKAEWINITELARPLTIVIENVVTDNFSGLVLCDAECVGVSDIFDLNHIYHIKEKYLFSNANYSDKVIQIECNQNHISFNVDAEKGLFCPYCLNPRKQHEALREHTVTWNSVVFECSGQVADDNKSIEINII